MEKMPGQLHYSNSPLTEALLEIKITSAKSELDIFEGLHKVYRGLKKDYPNSSKLVSGNLDISTGPQLDTQITQKQSGYAYKSSDSLQIVQTRLDGFSFHRLAPYDCWDNFRNEAKRLWASYRKVIKPETIANLSLRYINQINLPQDLLNLSDYFLTVPQISKQTPEGGIGAYFYQLLIPQPSLQSVLIINQAMLPVQDQDPNTIPILLDLQLTRQLNIPQSEDDIWSFFEKMRVRKNEVFEASITDKTRELIK